MEKHSGKGTALRIQMIVTFIAATVMFFVMIAYGAYLIPKIMDNTFTLSSFKIIEWIIGLYLFAVFYNFIVDILYLKKYNERVLAIFGVILSTIVISIMGLIFILSIIFQIMAK